MLYRLNYLPLWSLLLLFAAVFGVGNEASASWKREGYVWSRIVEHKDGSRTFSKQDINTKTLTEWTKDANDILVKKRIFQLDKRGEPRLAMLFDGKESLLARTQYVYDDFGALKEEQLFNTRGQLLRRLVYGLEGQGDGRPMAFTYDPNRPKATPVKTRNAVDPIMPVDVKSGEGSGFTGAATPTRKQMAKPQVKAPKKKEKKSLRKRIGSIFRRGD